MTLAYLIGQLAGGVCDASILGQIPIFNVLAQDQAIEFGKKLVRHFHDSDYHIQKTAEKILSHESKENREFVVSNAKYCFKMVNAEKLLTEMHYAADILSMEKADAYLKKQQYLSDEEEQRLNTYLPPLVAAAVLQLQLWLVEQPEFLNQAIGTYQEKLAALYLWKQSVEDRFKSLSVNKDDIVADISEELKNLWIDYPFLEQENKEKELREFYKLPLGKFREDGTPDVNIHELLQKTIDSGNDRHKRMLVLMGAPGSGKTTVITYLLNNLKIDRPVRVYPLSGFVNMTPSNWPEDLLARAKLQQKDLSNSILILDGLDELDLRGQYNQFVEKLRTAWANNDDITNFTLILTCRTTRLDSNTLRCSHVILAPLSEQQISDFAVDYLGNCPPELKTCLEKKEDICDVLGIPILLYMVLALDLTVDSSISIADLYDEIFSLNGDHSIYRRCYNQQQPPISEALEERIQKVHLFSLNAAVAMFSREEVQEELEKDSYITLAQKTIGDRSTFKPKDLLVGQYFLLGHKEEKLYFVHRSIFEYFVALAIFNALVKLANTGKSPEELYKEMEPGKSCDLTPLATLLSLHHLSEFPEIKDFLHHLIQTNLGELSNFPGWAELTKLIFKYGLADAVPKRPHGGEQGLREETYRFLNLLDICRCVLLQTQSTPIVKPIDLIPEIHHNIFMFPAPYWDLLHNVFFADLSNLNLSSVNLARAYLPMASMCKANLSKASLSEANMYKADLSSADLYECDFSWANLSQATLSWTYLCDVDLSGADLWGANFCKASLSSSVILPDCRSYEAALFQDGEDVMLQFTDPIRWNILYPDKAVDPDRFRRKDY